MLRRINMKKNEYKNKFNQIIQNLITDISIYKADMEAYSTSYMNIRLLSINNYYQR